METVNISSMVFNIKYDERKRVYKTKCRDTLITKRLKVFKLYEEEKLYC